MTNGPKCSPHGWTLDTLEKHLSSRITALEDMLNEREKHNVERFKVSGDNLRSALEASEKATQKAEFAAEKRFDSVNEFRGMLSDQATRLMPRVEYEIQHKSLADKLEDTSKQFLQLQAVVAARKEGVGITGMLVISGFTALASIVSVLTLIVHIYKPA